MKTLPAYRVEVFAGSGPTDPADDNVDVEVTFEDGRRYGATCFTLRNIARLMENYVATGECAGGLYFWCVDLVVIRDVSQPSIEKCVAHLVAEGDLDRVFARLDEARDSTD